MMGLEVPGLRWGARIRPTFQEQKGGAWVVLEKGLTTAPWLQNARNIATTCFGHLLVIINCAHAKQPSSPEGTMTPEQVP